MPTSGYYRVLPEGPVTVAPDSGGSLYTDLVIDPGLTYRHTMPEPEDKGVPFEAGTEFSQTYPISAARRAEPQTEAETASSSDAVPMPRPLRPRVFVVANQKGGVGKTTTAVNLAVALAQGGLRVLVVDLDPQGNASTALGVDHRLGARGTYEVLLQNDTIAEDVVPSGEHENVIVLPATLDLAGAEIELVSQVARENRLAKALTQFLSNHEVDYVLIDCPPSLGLLTVNALVAAREILLPIQCEYYALEGVSQLMRTIDLVKSDLNDQLMLTTVLLTMFDSRTKLASGVADEVRRHFGAETLDTVVPRSVRVSEAPSYGKTVLTYDPASVGAKTYRAAAREIADRGASPDLYARSVLPIRPGD